VVSLLNVAAQGLFTVLFPSDCRICGALLQNVSRLPVCPACLESMERLRVPVCAVCGERLEAMERASQERLCGACRMDEPPFVRAIAYGGYSDGLRELIQLLKYQGVRPAANVLGRMLAEAILELSEDFGDSAPIVVPVPLHSSKQRQRGFNQSELIARAAIRNFFVRGVERLSLDTGLLERARETQSQTGLSADQRKANVRGAFRVTRRDRIAGRDILLIDDVFTTGTTLRECARVLRRAGAPRVFVATVARALKPEAAFAQPEQKEQERPLVMAAHA
jgi:ComF family protein